MKSLKLIFGTHNSQPVGNFNFINEKVYQNAYKPFLQTLYKYPDFPVTLYYSGILLEWIEEYHPEYLMLLDEMIKRKQVELLGGGFYEPVLSLIPNSDKLGQIESLTTYIRSHFGKRPRGSWITERVWEPYLASIMQNSGIEYIFLDDIHFKAAGLKDHELFYPYLTEDQGKSIAVYPLSRPLMKMIPGESPEAIIKYLEETADETGERVVSVINNGEMFGDWTDSHRRIYKENWLESLINLLLKNNSWLELIQPGKYLRKYNCRGKIYIGCMVYEDMQDWMLTSEADRDGNTGSKQLRNTSCGTFRRFLCKYEECNLLYSKMIYVSILVNQIKGDKYKKKAAKEELWRGQTNTVYWHGNFDGLYSNHLRKEVYKSLLEAEKLTRIDGVFLPSIVSVDFDTDGRMEYLYQGKDLNAYVHSRGGMLFELDYLPVSWNYLDNINRYREPYHDAIAKHNSYDWYLRKGFIDHFFTKSVALDYFKSMNYPEAGDFITSHYSLENIDKDKFELALRCNGKIKNSGLEYQVQLNKLYTFKKSGINVKYIITNLSDQDLVIRFAVENNFALASTGPENCNVLKIREHSIELTNEAIEETGLSKIDIKDLKNNVQLELCADKEAGLWCFPNETFSRTLNVINKIYQSSCFLFYWDLNLKSREKWETEISVLLS